MPRASRAWKSILATRLSGAFAMVDRVTVFNDRGSLELKARVTIALEPGSWSRCRSGGASSRRTVATLTN